MVRLKQSLLLAAVILGTYLTLPVAAQNFIWASVNGMPLGPGFTVTGPGKFADGSATAPSVAGTGVNENTGWFWEGTDILGFTANGTQQTRLDANGLTLADAGELRWGSSGVTSADVALVRGSANQLNLGTGDSFNIVLGKFGYGAQSPVIDGATTVAITSGRIILNCTGAELIQTITGGLAGMTLIIEHGDTECTLDDDDDGTAANAIDLVGTGTDDIGAVNKIIALYYNGTYWMEMWESDN